MARCATPGVGLYHRRPHQVVGAGWWTSIAARIGPAARPQPSRPGCHRVRAGLASEAFRRQGGIRHRDRPHRPPPRHQVGAADRVTAGPLKGVHQLHSTEWALAAAEVEDEVLGRLGGAGVEAARWTPARIHHVDCSRARLAAIQNKNGGGPVMAEDLEMGRRPPHLW